MRFIHTILPLAALISAAPTSTEPTIPSHDLKLVLEGTGEDAVWRLLDANIPAHVDTSPGTTTSALARRSASLTLDKRWEIQCHDSNKAEATQCRVLADSVRNSRSPIPRSPRQIVYGNCYISWSAVVNKDQSSLYYAAADTTDQCRNGVNGNGEPLVSGVAKGYLEVGVAQCLSNRGTGCTN
ncbi:hypothetical protein P153DRAFT_430747 [Dothidotthia symphoricarpi CBS 119687]|uniref:WD-like domain-containing protein n=1 Tax=Dothidotthia symphoricarpi CBS 119687 TaxID=1392245 RepID=A0A6A6AI62_9PLEO|nr:uncharacterized protein P153DRAFT_430747 [Dothidotthia symphoricarpi CBS 119687]KAF2130574.1 hypothetical protein P153DRAFT_430747 [Dothidotthia symphoricarpi CBS 119687]